MRAIGAIYVLQFVMMVIVRAPIRAVGPDGTLELAATGDPLASFLVDTWVTLGLVMAAVGAALLIGSGTPDRARALIWTVLGIELTGGIINDVYMIQHGYSVTVYAVWIVLHTAIIVAGLIFLRDARRAEDPGPAMTP